ncbi:beta-ketoacyl synthase N-terminal-like domain-containing protein [Janthinobacterium sp.]|uniref:type I polyketide synthase n=1 Tax=Janthinobacterium sp. TaxID=1871054 RepID=UPI002583318D|nr:beta-ketoacyl synthase N-terminal-like domain-containing protein [Janthinobacterium sp.]
MTPLASDAGIGALYAVLNAGLAQAMVLQGNVGKIRQQLRAGVAAGPAPASEEASVTASDTGQLSRRILAILLEAVSTQLKIRPDDIDADIELRELGFDSVTLTELGNRLNQEYALALAPTIFFEYPTLDGFAGYLGRAYPQAFAAHVSSSQPASAPVAPMARPVLRRQPPAAADGVGASASSMADEPIAIIGMSACFPMARNLEDFWDKLLSETDCISEIPDSRWDWRACYGDAATQQNKTRVKWGGFIEGIDAFDPLFFGISPKEAETIDPQQRLLMMHVWKAIEDAGYAAASLSGTRTAIYVGTGPSGYGSLLAQSGQAIEGYTATGLVPSVGPNRMSYLLNLHGPSEPVETACSSSLIALRKGVAAIRSGGCTMAIVGGVNTIITPEAHISFSKAGMLAEDGRCKTFSAQANGYARGEGVGMLVLKPRGAAERDGDHIYGLIRGTSENHGGRSASLTAPNPAAQAQLLKDAYADAGVDPRTIGYIEAHGTGTPLGDPIEVNGLKMAFQALYDGIGAPAPDAPHCGLGSVKSNIGHLELAAGVAGVIKVLLQLQHRTLVRTLHCADVNPYIDLQNSPFYLVRQTRAWEALHDDQGQVLPRRAGVSSFGFGGVNAHVVLEEYVARPRLRTPGTTPESPVMVVLSAKNAERLQEQAQQLLAAIVRNAWTDADLPDLAYTLQVGREAMEERLALLAGSMAQLQAMLEAFVAGKKVGEGLFTGGVKRNKEALAMFSSDEQLQHVVGQWLAHKKFSKVLELWVKGMAFDWTVLYRDHGADRPQRMSLPTYPFARVRYWVPEAPRPAEHADRPAASPPATVESSDASDFLALLDRVSDGSVSIEAAVRTIEA